MTLDELLNELADQGIRLSVEGEQLRVSAAAQNSLTTELIEQLKVHKRALISGLSSSLSSTASLPRVVPDISSQFDPFPLTDIQQAYWIGRGNLVALGGVSTYTYTEYDCIDLDCGRLEQGLNELIERHHALRTIIQPDGFQRVLPEVADYRIASCDLRQNPEETRESELRAIRDAMSHQVLPTESWPLFDIRTTLLPDGITRLHIGVDLLIADFASLAQMFAEWRQLYLGDSLAPQPELTFRDYVQAETKLRDTPNWAESRDYWRKRIENLAGPPDLPLAGTDAKLQFRRLAMTMDRTAWSKIKRQGRSFGLSPSATLLAAFGLVLGQWAAKPEFGLMATHFSRLPFHPDIARVAGDYTSSLLVEVKSDAESSFSEHAIAIQARLANDLEHGVYSGVQVVRDLRANGRSARQSSYPIVFTSILPFSTAGGTGGNFEAFGHEVYGISQTPQVWLDHVVREEDGNLSVRWDVREGIFDSGMIEDMLAAFKALLSSLASGPDAWNEVLGPPLSSVDLCDRANANKTERAVETQTLLSLFEKSLAQYPDAVAVISEDRVLSYRDLAIESDAIAARLDETVAKSRPVVALSLERGWKQVVAALAVLKLGGVFVPLSVGWPSKRKKQIVQQAEAEAIVTDDPQATETWKGSHRFKIVPFDARSETSTANFDPINSDPHDLAYVIYTSGSTGEPKGVMIEHGSAVNTILDVNQRFGVTCKDRVLAISDLAFDLSIFDIFGMLAAGGAIVTLGQAPHANRDPSYWARLIEEHGVTVWNSVPALMGMLTAYLSSRGEGLLSGLKLVMLSGDWIPVTLPDSVRMQAPTAKIYSLGGATEVSIWSVYFPITETDPDWPSVPYGYPLANQKAFVLDASMRDCPRYVSGDLYLGGKGLARGYHGRLDLTQASFIQHPQTGERLYRTGDRARYLADGVLEFLGREDGQIKIDGFRVELGEIEKHLTMLDGVRDAAAVVISDSNQRRWISAAIVASDCGVETDLIAELSRVLPSYMVPREVRSIEALPLSANGKLDRKALSQLLDRPETRKAATGFPASGRPGILEDQLASILARVLNHQNIDANTNFFELGASSLDLISVHAEVERELGLTIEPVLLFEYPTIRMLASYLTSKVSRASPERSGKNELRRKQQMRRRAKGRRKAANHSNKEEGKS